MAITPWRFINISESVSCLDPTTTTQEPGIQYSGFSRLTSPLQSPNTFPVSSNVGKLSQDFEILLPAKVPCHSQPALTQQELGK